MSTTKRAFTLEEIKLADELAFPEDMKRLFQKHSPDDGWFIYYGDWLKRHERSLPRMIFNYSRADYENGMGKMFESIILDLIGKA